MEERAYELGLDSFMQVSAGPDGGPIDGAQVIRDTVEEGVLAEAVGIDSFNVGEHYRDDMMDSAGHVVLAAIAGRWMLTFGQAGKLQGAYRSREAKFIGELSTPFPLDGVFLFPIVLLGRCELFGVIGLCLSRRKRFGDCQQVSVLSVGD